MTQANQQTNEPVAWEYRFLNTSPYTVNPGWGAWERIKPKGLQSLADAVQEIRDYITKGYRYELRALYAAPVVPPVALPALTDEQVKERAAKAGLRWIDPIPDEDGSEGYPGGFDMSSLDEIRAILAASAAPAPEQMQPTDAMALAFHRATSEGSIGSDDVEEIKKGLRAALSAVPPTVKE